MVDGTFTVGEFLLFVFYLSRVMLTITDLAYGYPGSENGIVNINLISPRGSLTVIIGYIGSSKSTSLRVLLGLLPRDSGEIMWNGHSLNDPAS